MKKGNPSSLLSANFNDEDSILAAVQNVWHHRETLKHSLERQWYQQIAWYLGHQYLIWDDTRAGLRTTPAPSYRVRQVVNLLQPIAKNMAAKLYRNSPIWDVLPATTDSYDMQKSEISRKVLESHWYRLMMDEKMLEVLIWVMTTGNCFVKSIWNPEAGPPVAIPDEDGNFQLEDDIPIGDLETHIVNGFEMIVDPNAGVFRDARWCLESKLTHVEDLKERFPDKDIDPEHHSGSFARYSKLGQRLKSLIPAGQAQHRGPAVYDNAMLENDTVVVHELWVKPYNRGRLRNGKFCVIANNKMLHMGDFPYLHRRLPYAHYQEILIPGRVWGSCTLEQLIPAQQAYNRTKSQLLENRNLMANPKWLVKKGSGVLNTALTGQPGEKVETIAGLEPELIQPPSVPSYVERMLEHDKRDMEDISGVHDAGRGMAPGDVRGTGGVNALIEQSETPLSLITRLFEQATSEVGRQILALSAQNVTEQRLAKILGANDELMAFSYSGRDLIGNSTLPGVDYFDVRVRTVAGLPYTRAAQQAMLTQLIQVGVFNPAQNPEDKRLVMRLLSLGDTQNHLDESRIHRSRQLNEINDIVEGVVPRVEMQHNHAVHLDELYKYMNTARYDELPTQTKALLQQHAMAHKQYMAYEQVEPEMLLRGAAQAAIQKHGMQALMQGGPDEGQRLQGSEQQRSEVGDERPSPQQGEVVQEV